MSRYTIQFVTLSQVSNVVPFSGLTMRKIYNRFVLTGQRPVENTQTVTSSEEDPYDPSQDYLSRVQELKSRAIVDDTIVEENSEVNSEE